MTEKTEYSTRIILVGGHPKNYAYPFHEQTRSGQILRRILDRNHLIGKFVIIDLWQTELEEAKGELSDFQIKFLKNKNNKVIALGKWVYNCMKKYQIECEYLPHPASRRGKDIEKLEVGLILA